LSKQTLAWALSASAAGGAAVREICRLHAVVMAKPAEPPAKRASDPTEANKFPLAPVLTKNNDK
jgi:hypothetical protein